MSLRIATNLFGSGVNSNINTYDYPSKTVTLNTITADPLYLNTSSDSLEGELSLSDNKLSFLYYPCRRLITTIPAVISSSIKKIMLHSLNVGIATPEGTLAALFGSLSPVSTMPLRFVSS